MKNELKNVKVGDWIGVAGHGWFQITNIYDGDSGKNIIIDGEIYNIDGVYLPVENKVSYPSAFLNPPECLMLGPKPNGQKVLGAVALMQALVDHGYTFKRDTWSGHSASFLKGMWEYCGKSPSKFNKWEEWMLEPTY